MDKLHKNLFKAIKEELIDEGLDIEEVNKLIREFSWFMSPMSGLRMLLRSGLTVKEFKNSLIFLSNRHERLEKEIKPNSTVLDVGSGLGLLACTLASKGCIVHGTEISDDNIRIAQRLSKLQKVNERCIFHKVEGTKLPFPNETFDVTVLSWALHDIKEEEQDSLLSECIRILKRKGNLLIVDQEKKLDFARTKRFMADCQLIKTREETLSTVFDHGITSKAKLVEYRKPTKKNV